MKELAVRAVPPSMSRLLLSVGRGSGFSHALVYYCSDKADEFDFELFENVLCIEAFGEDYAPFTGYRVDALYNEDEDDSNDEDNWRNDYPDEDYR